MVRRKNSGSVSSVWLVDFLGALPPPQSAQFDLGGLLPRPSGALPLHLQGPLDEGVAELMLGAEPVAALSGLLQAALLRDAQSAMPILGCPPFEIHPLSPGGR